MLAHPEISMHMPGHCQNPDFNCQQNKLCQEHSLSTIESTTDSNFGGLGNYFPPTGAIFDALKACTAFYNSKSTLFSINGSTGSLIGMTRLIGGPKKKVLV